MAAGPVCNQNDEDPENPMPSMMRRLPVSLALCGLVLAGGFAAPPARAGVASTASGAAGQAQPAAQVTPHGLPGAPSAPVLPDVASYVLMDMQTGTVIAEKGAMLPRAPASLTKLMTAYLTYQAIADGKLKPDQDVPVSVAAWKAGGSRMFIAPGMTVTVDQLLHGLVIDSGNDSAVALAQAVAGTQDAFVQRMNAAAEKLGLTGTHYSNVSGLPDPGLQTTALDVAKLSRAILLEYPGILQISAQKHYTFNKIRQRSWNPVLFRDPSVDGLKTGLTDAAGHSIDATSLRNGSRLIAVELGGPSWASGTSAIEVLLDYGYQFFQDAQIAKAGAPLGEMTDTHVTPERIAVGAAKDLVLTVPSDSLKSIKTSLHLAPNPPQALPKGTPVGTISYSLAGTVLATEPAVTLSAAHPAGFVTRMMRRLSSSL
jgi:D-alanyl-D-alanine carboxypeptidase (penicillin-binding protein 5/6)